MPSTHKGFTHYYEKARDNGRTIDDAFEYAADKYLTMVYDAHGFSEDQLTRSDLVCDMLSKYHIQCDRKRSHKEAVAQACKWAKEEVQHREELVNAGRKKDVWDHFEDMYDALPDDMLKRGSLFEEDMRKREARRRERPEVRTGTYFTDGPPVPMGRGQYTMPPPIYPSPRPKFAFMNSSPQYPGSTSSGSSYTTEERRPGGSVRDEHTPPRNTSYTTEERRPRGTARNQPPPCRYTSSPRRGPSQHTSHHPDPRAYQRETYTGTSSSSHRTNSHRSRSPSPQRRHRSHTPPPFASDYTKPTTDLYAVLGLSRRATTDQIKAARRTMGLLYHPDKAVARGMDEATATEKMREINRAYDVLSDGKNREWYDRTGYLPGKAS